MNKDNKMKQLRAHAAAFAREAACEAGVLAQHSCGASEEDRHEPHGRFAAHDAAAKRVFPVAFAAELAHLIKHQAAYH